MNIPISDEFIEYMVKENNSQEIGVLISLLCYYYLKEYNLSINDLIKSLKNSIMILERED